MQFHPPSHYLISIMAQLSYHTIVKHPQLMFLP